MVCTKKTRIALLMCSHAKTQINLNHKESSRERKTIPEKPSKETVIIGIQLFTFSYCTPFVTVVSIQEPSLSASSAKKKPADEEGLLSGGKMVATSTTASSKHLVRRQARTSSPVATANQKEPGYVTVLEIGNNNNNNNNNHKAEVKRPTHHHQHRFASYQF